MGWFCRGELWNSSESWNVEDSPDFSLCIEKSYFVYIPCIFLWVFLPFEIYNLRHTKAYNIPLNLYNIFKLIVIISLEILSLINIIQYVFQDESRVLVDIYSPVIKFLTFALFFGLTYANIKCGIRSSGTLFLFSFLLMVFSLPQYRTEFRIKYGLAQTSETTEFITYMIYFPLCVVIFILNCFADARPVMLTYPVDKDVCPENQSSFLSKILFAWFDAFAWKGYNKPLEDGDLWSLDYMNTSSHIVPMFEKHWKAAVDRSKNAADVQVRMVSENNGLMPNGGDEAVGVSYKVKKSKKTASIFRPLVETFGLQFLLGSLLKILQDTLTFVNPQILSLLIAFVTVNENKPREPMWRGYLYAILLFLVAFCQTLLLAQYFHKTFQIGVRVRTALIAVIYKKALSISNGARKNFTMGEIVNLMAVDAQRFVDLMGYINMLWSAPLQIILAVYFLWILLGPSVLAGLAVMIILIPVNGLIASSIKSLQIKQMKNKDDRVKLMNEILSGIKVLKLYAWEPSFEKQVVKIRNKEIKVLKTQAYLSAGTSFLWACAPFLVSLVTFAVYVLSSDKHVLDAQTAFVSLSLFNILRFPLSMLPMMITNLVQTSVSVKRINKFLNSEDLDPNAVSHENNREEAIYVEDGNFSWDGYDGPSCLKNVNVKIKPGSLVAIVGPVGCGKSSLLSAFLGEMYKQSGFVNTKGTIAYVPQQAWVQNATLKDNITFGDNSNNSYYEKVLEACALTTDLSILPAGDQTEIGEKGINLSGGQKQRISLARAVFFGADVYLLDDPLSAVDSHVGKHLFDQVVGPSGLLKGKTRLLVTHSVTYLPQVDNIFVLKDGAIAEFGTFNELLEKKGDFADFLITYFKESNEDENVENLDKLKEMLVEPESIVRQLSKDGETGSVQSLSRQRSVSESESVKKKPEPKNVVGQKLIETEKAETGNVKFKVYAYYLAAVGPFLVIATIVMNFFFQSFSLASNMWLSAWSSDPKAAVNGIQNIDKTHMYLGVYAVLGVGQAISVLLGAFFQAKGMLAAAKALHGFMLTRTFRAPLKFFDTTPIGRIVNRFGKDVDTLDNTLPQIVRSWLMCLFGVISTLFIISYSTPIFVIVIIPVFGVYYCVQRFYVATSRQLKRLESVSRSPIYSHFGESVAGAQSIRAYGIEHKFIQESESKVDYNQRSYYPNLVSNRWLSVRLETVGNLIIFFAALFAVLGRDTLSAGLVGLSVSYALQITQTLNWLVRMTSEVETNIVAVERIKEYGETPQEAAWHVSNQEVPKNWPEKGEITFNDFKVRYREGLELVLHGISFHVNGTEKVGIVGRTGAGKSSLTLSLFRIIEAAGGKILIDGIDISKLGLHTLRSRLTIIPQDPVLFSGTLRLNLDPTEEHSDESIWRALELAHLKNHASTLEHGLQYEVTEGGENFSVGQRQLICLARALLRKTKVLILDEATAAIDLETDDLIQSTIRTEFKDSTVLTIAHRLNTILDYNRIIVLDKGKIVEFDSPASLLKSKNSVFYGMAVDAGLA